MDEFCSVAREDQLRGLEFSSTISADIARYRGRSVSIEESLNQVWVFEKKDYEYWVNDKDWEMWP